jgi:hypothetical protein
VSYSSLLQIAIDDMVGFEKDKPRPKDRGSVSDIIGG